MKSAEQPSLPIPSITKPDKAVDYISHLYLSPVLSYLRDSSLG
jgi:hypothetical protein